MPSRNVASTSVNSLIFPVPRHPETIKGSRLHVVLYFYILGSMKAHEAVQSLGALASDARLSMFRLLVKRGPEGYTPSELIERLDIPAPTLSFHLKELANAELVVSRREGRNLFYSPNFARMSALIAFLTENCCSLADESCGPDCQPLAAVPQKRKHT